MTWRVKKCKQFVKIKIHLSQTRRATAACIAAELRFVLCSEHAAAASSAAHALLSRPLSTGVSGLRGAAGFAAQEERAAAALSKLEKMFDRTPSTSAAARQCFSAIAELLQKQVHLSLPLCADRPCTMSLRRAQAWIMTISGDFSGRSILNTLWDGYAIRGFGSALHLMSGAQ